MTRIAYCSHCRNTGFLDWRQGADEKPCHYCDHSRFAVTSIVIDAREPVAKLESKVDALYTLIQILERRVDELSRKVGEV